MRERDFLATDSEFVQHQLMDCAVTRVTVHLDTVAISTCIGLWSLLPSRNQKYSCNCYLDATSVRTATVATNALTHDGEYAHCIKSSRLNATSGGFFDDVCALQWKTTTFPADGVPSLDAHRQRQRRQRSQSADGR